MTISVQDGRVVQVIASDGVIYNYMINAQTAASNASTSETNAATSATNAATSATSAATSSTEAQAARDAAINFADVALNANDLSSLQTAQTTLNTNGGGFIQYEYDQPQASHSTTAIALTDRTILQGMSGASAANVNGQGWQASYSGTDAAFYNSEGHADTRQTQGLHIRDYGVKITGTAATAFRLWRSRQCSISYSTARLEADNQIGFHLKGERSGGSFTGAFDDYLVANTSVNGTGAAGIVHYKLSATFNDGQVNTTALVKCRSSGKGTAAEIGPTFGLGMFCFDGEGFDVAGLNFIASGSGASQDGGASYTYLEPGSTWVGLGRFPVISLDTLCRRMGFYQVKFGGAATIADIALAVDCHVFYGNTFYVKNGLEGFALRQQGDTVDRAEIRADGTYRTGDGTAAPHVFAGPSGLQFKEQVLSVSSGSVAPDLLDGENIYIEITAGAGAITLNVMGNRSGNQWAFVTVKNSDTISRGLITSASYIDSGITTIGAGETYAFAYRYISQISKWVMQSKQGPLS